MTCCHIDDTLIASTEATIADLKNSMKTHFTIKELSPLNKHLGVRYEWINEADKWRVKATLHNLDSKIITIIKNVAG